MIGPTIGRLEYLAQSLTNPEIELQWLDQALAGEPRAVLWQGIREIVVPLSYQRDAALDLAREHSAQRGWPVRIRRSGGGAVPQGPGILNLSLALPMDAGAGVWMTPVYRYLSALLTDALARLGVAAVEGEVIGSFCDGRYNLALAGSSPSDLRKLVGTAQYWRRSESRHAVLAHALLLIDCDPVELTDGLNAFEAELAAARRYESERVITLAAATGQSGAALIEALRGALDQALATVRLQAPALPAGR